MTALRVRGIYIPMSSLVAIYEAYLRSELFEVYCFDCHRLIGLSPRRRLAEMLRRVHVCE